jgi:DNA-binding response OmpR family regulator
MNASLLLVDDDRYTRTLLSDFLQSNGYAVTTAADGDEAIRLLESSAFDLVVTDIQLGSGTSGLDVLRIARNGERPPAVVMMTGDHALETAILALRNGAYDYILKPCNPDELLERLQEAEKRRSSELVQLDAIRTIVQIASQFEGQFVLL